MSSFGAQQISELRQFVQAVKAHPELLDAPDLKFFKDYIESLGGKIPAPKAQKSTPTPTPTPTPKAKAEDVDMTDKKEEAAHHEDEFDESKLREGDTELMTPDTEPPLEVGDISVTPTEEMMDEASALRAKALEVQYDNEEEAISILTQAIKLYPQGAILYATRADILLRMKRPNAAISDCSVAIRINPDSAKPYKVRGKAYRYLGKYVEAHTDLCKACQLDWDETSAEMIKFLQPRAEKVRQFKLQKERQQAEDAARLRKERRAAAEEAHKKQQQQQQHQHHHQHGAHCNHDHDDDGDDDDDDGEPGAFDNIFNDPEIQSVLKNPELIAKVQEAIGNPNKMAELMKDPRFAKLAPKLAGLFGGAPMGGESMGGVPPAGAGGAQAHSHSHSQPKAQAPAPEAGFDLD